MPNPYKLLKLLSRLAAFAMLLSIMGCVTLNDDHKKEDKQAKLIETQQKIVLNYLSKGLADRAHVELRVLLRDYPENAEFRNLMGLTKLALKQPYVAIKYFRQAYKMKESPAFILNMASAYIALKQYKKAISVLKKQVQSGLASYPYPERFYHNIGLCYESLKNDKLAVTYYRKALKINPVNYMTILQLSKLFEQRQMTKQARKGYLQANHVCPICYEPVKLLALTYVREGRKDRAAEILDKYARAINVQPDDKAKAFKFLASLKN